MTYTIKAAITILVLAVSPQLFANSCPSTLYDTNVSVFDSSTAAVPGVVIPVGGSGIGNGNFTVCDGIGVQIGARVSERFVGPITPNASTGDYIAPIGDGTPANLAQWNFEGHIDLSHLYGQGVPPESFADITYAVQVDCDPSIDGIDGPSFPLNLIPDTVILLQFSQNIGFSFLCQNYGSGFDSSADGHYTLRAVVSDGSGILAEVRVNAIVGSPTNSSKISAAGMIESQVEGFKFPDGSVQATAATPHPPVPGFPSTYINSVNTDSPPGGQLAFAACDAGDTIIGGGGRCRGSLFGVDVMHKSCPANVSGACLDNGGANFETWAVECEGTSRSFAYAVCLDTTP